MSYTKIEDLTWDTLPGGTLVSTVQLFDEFDSAENPDDEADPLLGPATVEYRIVDGEMVVGMSTGTPMSV